MSFGWEQRHPYYIQISIFSCSPRGPQALAVSSDVAQRLTSIRSHGVTGRKQYEGRNAPSQHERHVVWEKHQLVPPPPIGRYTEEVPPASAMGRIDSADPPQHKNRSMTFCLLYHLLFSYRWIAVVPPTRLQIRCVRIPKQPLQELRAQRSQSRLNPAQCAVLVRRQEFSI